MPCTPQNTIQTCTAQELVLDQDTGDLSITNGNTVNLQSIVKLLETQTQVSSLTLTGTILQIIYIGEDGVQQARNVDLAPLITDGSLDIENSNSIALSFDGTRLRADLIIDPASTAPITASSNGLNIGCCTDLPITANVTNTVQLIAAGASGHVLTANLKYQDSPSINFFDSSSGLSASVKLSTDSGNSIIFGSDNAIYAPSAGSQLASLPTNGFITTGASGTLLVGSDSKTYRIPDAIVQDPIIGIDTNTVDITVIGISNHTIQADVKTASTNTVQFTSTPTGLNANVKVDNVAPGNIAITSTVNGLVATANAATIAGIQSNLATVQNPLIKVFGTLNNNNAGYAAVSISQYGVKVPIFTTNQRISIPGPDLYDSMLVFDSNIRQFMWYDAVNGLWVQVGSASNNPTPPPTPTIKITGVVDAVSSPFVAGNTYVNNAMINYPVEVVRNKLFEPDVDPGNGDSYFTKVLNTNTITFSPALAAGELIQVIVLPS